MFQPGELLVYGTTGVCRVEGVATPNLTRAEWGRQYYLLKPLYQDGVIYAPVDSQKVPIRPVISRQEAEDLIDLIPSIQAEACHAPHPAGPGPALSVRRADQRLQRAGRAHDVHLCQTPSGGSSKPTAWHGG